MARTKSQALLQILTRMISSDRINTEYLKDVVYGEQCHVWGGEGCIWVTATYRILSNHESLLQVGVERAGSSQSVETRHLHGGTQTSSSRQWGVSIIGETGSCLCRGTMDYDRAGISGLRRLILWWNRTKLPPGWVYTLKRQKRTERIVQGWTHFKSSVGAVQWAGGLKPRSQACRDSLDNSWINGRGFVNFIVCLFFLLYVHVLILLMANFNHMDSINKNNDRVLKACSEPGQCSLLHVPSFLLTVSYALLASACSFEEVMHLAKVIQLATSRAETLGPLPLSLTWTTPACCQSLATRPFLSPKTFWSLFLPFGKSFWIFCSYSWGPSSNMASSEMFSPYPTPKNWQLVLSTKYLYLHWKWTSRWALC